MKEVKRVTPVPAATVVLMRFENQQLEVFLQQRHPNSKFVGGAYVFPGGKLDPEDRNYCNYSLTEPIKSESNQTLLNLAHGQAYFIAVLRETFEESGILLAYESNQTSRLIQFDNPVIENKFRRYREQLANQEIEFAQMCAQENLTLALDQLFYFSHWITPSVLPIRYDTRFFLAHMPSNQVGSHDDYEAVDSIWINPQTALANHHQGELQLITPTLHTLQTLSQFTTPQDAIDGLFKAGMDSETGNAE